MNKLNNWHNPELESPINNKKVIVLASGQYIDQSFGTIEIKKFDHEPFMATFLNDQGWWLDTSSYNKIKCFTIDKWMYIPEE